jgi:N-acetylmuramoyl-L-alanine amidase
MAIHRVKQGECLSSIAHAYGFGDERFIYEHPNNEGLRAKRPDPNVLFPGDEVFVPDRAEKQVECATGRMHRFNVRRPRPVVRVVLKDRDGETIPDSDYVFRVGKEVRDGKTSGGLVEEPVPPDALRAELFVPAFKIAMRFDLQNLDPHDEATGAQQRLKNLRLYSGAVDADIGPRTEAALRAFQRMFGLEETGACDEKTRDALRKHHGC